MPKDAEMVTTEEVARMMGVSPKTVNRWDGLDGFPLPIRTPGGHRRWKRAEVEAYMLASRGEGRPS
jgi:DNA-binding transcriptional MerR regulator